jgi:hypothetical protein
MGNSVFAGAARLMVVCCVAGPAVIGAAAGSVIGGWLGLAVACVLAASVGLLLYLRRGKGGC